jgi:hypothetical protein
MTTGATGGYQPPGGERPLGTTDPMTGTSTYPETAVGGSSGGSKTDTAKQQASEVGSTAKQAGGQVAGTAKDQARQVAGEAKTQARDLMNETRTQVRDQAGTQQRKAASGLRSISGELRSMADGNLGQQGMVTDLARQAADKAQQLAGWLESREPGDLVEEVRGMARRKPGTFLLGAAAAGALAGRATRSAVDVKRSQSNDSSPYDTYDGGTSYAGTGDNAARASMAGDSMQSGTMGRDEEIILVEESVTVGSDPYAQRPTGGDRL